MRTFDLTHFAGHDLVPDVGINEAADRFELHARDGTVAELIYRAQDAKTLVLLHTEVPPGLRGRNVAGELAHAALDHARSHGLHVIAKCPYVRAFTARHPEYQDLVEE